MICSPLSLPSTHQPSHCSSHTLGNLPTHHPPSGMLLHTGPGLAPHLLQVFAQNAIFPGRPAWVSLCNVANFMPLLGCILLHRSYYFFPPLGRSSPRAPLLLAARVPGERTGNPRRCCPGGLGLDWLPPSQCLWASSRAHGIPGRAARGAFPRARARALPLCSLCFPRGSRA